MAHVVLPATHFGEKEGTYTNRHGRVQKLNAAVIAPEGALQDSEIFIRLTGRSGRRAPYATPAEIFAALTKEVIGLRGLTYDRSANKEFNGKWRCRTVMIVDIAIIIA